MCVCVCVCVVVVVVVVVVEDFNTKSTVNLNNFYIDQYTICSAISRYIPIEKIYIKEVKRK